MTRIKEANGSKIRKLGPSADSEAPKLGRVLPAAEPTSNDLGSVVNDNDCAQTKARRYREVAIDGAETETGEHDYTARLMSERLPGQRVGGGRGAKGKNRARKPYVSKKLALPPDEQHLSSSRLRVTGLSLGAYEHWFNRRTPRQRLAALRSFIRDVFTNNDAAEAHRRLRERFPDIKLGIPPRGQQNAGAPDLMVDGLDNHETDILHLHKGLARRILEDEARCNPMEREWVEDVVAVPKRGRSRS